MIILRIFKKISQKTKKLKTGDKEMIRYSPEGFLINTQENAKATSSLEDFMSAFNENRIVEARSTYCDREHNLHIDLGFIHGIIPREEF